MEEKTILYCLAGVSVIVAAVLFIYRSQLLSRLSDKQIETIFGIGQETEVELNAVERVAITIKTRYPALIFLVPAIIFAILGTQVEQVKGGKEDWTIKGRFLTHGSPEQPSWPDGVLTIYPTDIKAKDVFEWGGFKITVAIPVGKTFEEMYEFIEYSSFDKRSRVLLIPGEEFEKYWSGKDKKSLLTSATKTARFYDEIPVRVVPAITIDSEGPN